MAPLFMVNELVLLPVDKTLRNLITSLYKMYSRSNLVCAIAHRESQSSIGIGFPGYFRGVP